MVMASESVKVIVRCRPLNQRERDLKSQVVISIDSSCGLCTILNPLDDNAPGKSFTFDGAYFTTSTTEQIYNEIVYPIVESVTEGYNGTVFAYGQTGCGKSFTMQGVSSPSSQKGIIPRAFEHIFEAISTTENAKFLVHASYLEIYNEEIRDLLGKETKKKLELKEHPDKGVYVPGLSLYSVHNTKECEDIMEMGWRNRSVGATLMNADSSRSHSIFTIHMEMLELEENGEHIKQGKLNLVDLAGSERQAKTGATGDRLKEATKINLSLSALGNVISALVDGKSKHIPYRDSKLTRMLQDSLGGNTKTLMVACLSPADNNYDETLSTLRYANRAKNIQNQPKINEDPKDALLREYQLEITRLKEMLDCQIPGIVANNNNNNTGTSSSNNNFLDSDQQPSEEIQVHNTVTKLQQEYDDKMKDLMTKYQMEQESNARLKDDVCRLKALYEQELAKLNEKKPSSVDDDVETIEVPNSPIPTHKQNGVETSEGVVSISAAETTSVDQMKAHAMERLQALEEQMVGGEKVHDKELKEKRAKRKTNAEKRVQLIAEALSKADDDDKAMLRIYDNIHEELRAKTQLLKKAKKKIQAFEKEVKDLSSEFESERTDFLDTIRKQDQQIKLLQQILDKVQPCLRRDCNYSNIEKIKSESQWDQDYQKWRIPELTVERTKLPPPGIQPGGRAEVLSGNSMRKVYKQNHSANSYEESKEDKFFRKLKKGEEEDIAGTYFKPKRQEQLLSKFKDAARRGIGLRKDSPNSSNGLTVNVIHREIAQNGFGLPHQNGGIPNGVHHNGSVSLSTSPSSSQPSSQDSSLRKPGKLQSLPNGETVPIVKANERRRRTRLNGASMEWPI